MTREPGPVATVVVCVVEESTLTMTCEGLIAERFDVLPAQNAGDALRLCRYGHPDVLILDLEAVEDPPPEFVQRVRDSDPGLGIIALAPRGDAMRKEVGADDSLAKPFRHEHLRARIDSILRRRHHRDEAPVRVGEILIDPGRRKVMVGDREVHLAKMEFTLLRVLASDPTRVFAKEELMREVWGAQGPGAATRTLDSHASRLRRKLDPGRRRYVVNCWGIGYRLRSDAVERSGPPDGPGGEEDRRGFAGRVRCLMDARGLSVAGLAERSLIDTPTVEAILAAEHPVWLDEIYLLAGALGLTPGELIAPEEVDGGGVDE